MIEINVRIFGKRPSRTMPFLDALPPYIWKGKSIDCLAEDHRLGKRRQRYHGIMSYYNIYEAAFQCLFIILIFRYSGRTQKQMQDFVRENFVKRQSFQR